MECGPEEVGESEEKEKSLLICEEHYYLADTYIFLLWRCLSIQKIQHLDLMTI